MNNDFSGSVDVPEKRTAYATLPTFFKYSARDNINPRLEPNPALSTSTSLSIDHRFTANNQKQQRYPLSLLRAILAIEIDALHSHQVKSESKSNGRG